MVAQTPKAQSPSPSFYKKRAFSISKMRKRPGTNLHSAIVNVWRREVGELSSRSFIHRLRASEDLVLRLDIFRRLEKHRGCVNTISFNAYGDILVSGSDDRRVILWDWETGHVKLSFHSSHHNNVFQAKIMPYTDDRSIVTCAADGQVRHAQILERGPVEPKLLGKHDGRAHKLAIEPGSPHIFYTCGEDGLVQHFDLRSGAATRLFTCKSPPDRNFMPIIQLNAIAIDPRNPNLFAVAGSDEYTRVYDIRKYNWDGSTDFGQPVDYFCPPHLIGNEGVGITGLAFSDQSELLASYNDEFIYLFTRDMGLGPDPAPAPASPVSMGSDAGEVSMEHQSTTSPSNMDTDAGVRPQVYKGHRNCETVKGVNFFGPKSEYVMSGSDCGRIFIWKKKGGELIRVMEADKDVVNCIECHPHTTVLASSGIEHDIKIWTPTALDKAVLPAKIEKVRVPRRIYFLPIGISEEEDEEEEDDDDDDYYDFYDSDDDDDDGDDDTSGDDYDDDDSRVGGGDNDDDIDDDDDGDNDNDEGGVDGCGEDDGCDDSSCDAFDDSYDDGSNNYESNNDGGDDCNDG